MNQFTLSDTEGRHLGFLVMMAEDEYDEAPESGYAALRLLGEQLPCNRDTEQLAEAAAHTLAWQLDGDKVWLYDENGETCGHIRQEWLILGKSRFALGDLTGVL